MSHQTGRVELRGESLPILKGVDNTHLSGPRITEPQSGHGIDTAGAFSRASTLPPRTGVNGQPSEGGLCQGPPALPSLDPEELLRATKLERAAAPAAVRVLGADLDGSRHCDLCDHRLREERTGLGWLGQAIMVDVGGEAVRAHTICFVEAMQAAAEEMVIMAEAGTLEVDEWRERWAAAWEVSRG